ncbi:MAG: GIY-YIG nuclease family protein [Proteobacteria bacterium]|nr:GIY-YIG nuclease family protein [Pseudomonadota bacterium]
MSESGASWYLYLIRCGDGSLYTGITTDVSRRLAEHRNIDAKGKGAKSLRGKQPLTVAFSTAVGSRSAALKIEYAIKQLGKADKEALLGRQLDLDTLQRVVRSDE